MLTRACIQVAGWKAPNLNQTDTESLTPAVTGPVVVDLTEEEDTKDELGLLPDLSKTHLVESVCNCHCYIAKILQLSLASAGAPWVH